jgi:hypothetical protein
VENKPKFRPNPNLKLMDQVREVLRYYHYVYSLMNNHYRLARKLMFQDLANDPI